MNVYVVLRYNDAGCMQEVKFVILIAKAVSIKAMTLFTSKLDLNLRKKLVKCYIAVYCAEIWTRENVSRTFFKHFEMWCWRRMEKISWTGGV